MRARGAGDWFPAGSRAEPLRGRGGRATTSEATPSEQDALRYATSSGEFRNNPVPRKNLPTIDKPSAVFHRKEKIAMIKIENLSKTFHTADGSVEALKNVSLDIADGDIFGIIGMSGAGKSTLVRCINLLECLKNVCFPLELAGYSRQDAQKRAKELLETVGLLDKANAYPSQLSGGQQQRVAIARALATNPKVLLCDEATSALDPTTTNSILELIQEINQKTGITVVVITHQMSVVEKICRHVAILDGGEVAEQGEVTEVFSHPRRFRRQRTADPHRLQRSGGRQYADYRADGVGKRHCREHCLCLHQKHRRQGLRTNAPGTSRQR